jgi:tRNA nucleotidyltransferase (CCA-adding enzyme)
MRGDRDIDLFVAWPRNLEKGKIVESTFKAVKASVPAKWITRYAEHPYLQTEFEGYKIEVVPCFKMSAEEKKISAVDRTVLHMDYLQNKLKEKQRRDVRVLKALLKANRMYGAEADVEGFSGLICEYLVLNYRSLAGLIEAAKDWKPPVVVDVEGAYKNRVSPKELAERFGTEFVIVDVVDSERNAAAAVSATNLSRFITLSRAFWNSPSARFFEKQEVRASAADVLEAVERRDSGVLLIEFDRSEALPDTLVPQLRHSAKAVEKHLEILGFRPVGRDAFATEEKCFILLEFESLSLSSVERVNGPPAGKHEDCEAFLRKQRNVLRGPFVEGDRIVLEKARDVKTATIIAERVVKYPEMYGVSKDLQENIKRGRVYEGKWICRCAKAIPALAEYFFKRDPWLEHEQKQQQK